MQKQAEEGKKIRSSKLRNNAIFCQSTENWANKVDGKIVSNRKHDLKRRESFRRPAFRREQQIDNGLTMTEKDNVE